MSETRGRCRYCKRGFPLSALVLVSYLLRNGVCTECRAAGRMMRHVAKRRCSRPDCSGWTFDANPACEDCR